MKLKSKDLINALTIVRPGLAKKAIVEQATHFIFTGEEILTYNDRICIAYPFKTDFKCSVPAEEFYKILTNINKDEIDLQLKENKLVVDGKNVKAVLTTETGTEVAEIVKNLNLQKMQKQAKPLPKNFIEGLLLCMFSASKDQTNSVLTCLFVEDEYIASTDDLRISEYVMDSKMDCSLLIPATSAAELIKFEVVHYHISKDGSWVYFFTDKGAIFCSRTTLGNFPLYETFFDGFEEHEIKLPENLQQSIQTASILTEGEIESDKEVEIEISEGKLKCKGQNKIGWVESELSVDTNQNIKFSINPTFFIKILSHTKSMYFGNNKALFKSKNFRHIIALKAS